MSDILSQLRTVAADLRTLEHDIGAATAPPSVLSRRIPFFGNVEIPVPVGDFGMQSRSFDNGAEDVFITSIGCVVKGAVAGTTAVGGGTVLREQEAGFGTRLHILAAQVPVIQTFDFEWNYQLASTQSLYCSAANGAAFLSRRSLGYMENVRPLKFPSPGLKVAGGDTLQLMARPTLFRVPTFETFTLFLLDFVLMGYRIGSSTKVPA